MNPFENRKYVIVAIIILIGLAFIIRLFTFQVLNNKYRESADNNSMRFVTQYPARGLVYDRNNVLLVYNEAAYDLMVIPKQVKSFDTTELASLLHVDKSLIISQLNAAKKYSYYKPSIFMKQISTEDYANIQEKLYKFLGFYAQTRTLRKYHNSSSAHILGYVGEVNDKIINSNPYYKSGDYIGISGIERSYETV
ncbi:MAG: penicillin-binding protein 2, partial [Bacteroidota bacterium]